VIEAHGSIDAMIHCAGIIQPFVRLTHIIYKKMKDLLGS